MRRLLPTSIALGTSLIWGGIATAQVGTDATAAVHSGMCTELGQEVATLDPPRPEDGAWVGVEGLGVVLESETDDVVSGRVLLDTPHSIVVSAGDTPVACGEIGGYANDEDLDIGLQPVGDSGYFGVATLDDVDDDDGGDDDDDVEIDLPVFQPVR